MQSGYSALYINALCESLACHTKKQLKKLSNSYGYSDRSIKRKNFLLTSHKYTVECAPLADEGALRG